MMFKNKYGTIILIILSHIIVLSSCKQVDLFEKNTNIPNLKWQNDFDFKSGFEIEDTTVLYNVYMVLRHTDAYEYNNIWLSVGLQAPAEAIKYQKINLKLGNDASGWDGIGMNDIWEVRKLLTRMPLKKGMYNFDIKQIMRDNPLRHIVSVGIRVEKAG